MKKKVKIKEPVHIRQKKLANGNVSLYLDIYYNVLDERGLRGINAKK